MKAKQTEGRTQICHQWYKHNNLRHTRELRVTNTYLMDQNLFMSTLNSFLSILYFFPYLGGVFQLTKCETLYTELCMIVM